MNLCWAAGEMARQDTTPETQPPPFDEEEERGGRFNKRLLVGLAVVVLAAAYLIFLALDAAGAVYLETDEAVAAGQDVYGKRLRLGGRVDMQSVVREGDGLNVRFTLDGESSQIPVVYNGAVPDIFGEGITVFVEGKFADDGVFHANVLLARHPDTMEVLQPGDTLPSKQN